MRLIAAASALRRDPCAYCNGAGGVLDHIEPRSRGGGDTDNLASACPGCNAGKGATPLLAYLVARAQRGVRIGVSEDRVVPPRLRPDHRKRHNSGVPTAVLDDRRLSKGAVVTLCVLALFADRDGWCWPDLDQLREHGRPVQRPRVSKALHELQRRGWIQISYEHHQAIRRPVFRLLFSRPELDELAAIA